MIGYEERWEYAVIGSVANQVARLCAAAEHGQILISERLLTAVNEIVETESIGELALKGFHRPLKTHNILRLRGESNPG